MTREEAIDKLKRWRRDVDDEKEYPEYSEGWFYKDDEIAFDMAIEALEERKTGKWIPYNWDKEDWLRSDGTPVFMLCSECNAMIVNNFAFRWNFCPECGCKMEVEK